MQHFVRHRISSICLTTFLLGTLFLTACSTQVEPPATNNGVFKTINYQLCKEASFGFKQQTPKSFRALVQCINGQDKVIQPYVDLMSAISDEDLKVYIESFDEHFSPFLNQALDLMNRMQERGLLREFSKNLAVLIESGVASSGLEIWRKVWGNKGEISTAGMDFNDFLSDLMANDRFRGAVRGWAGLMDNSNSWALAYLLSRSSSSESLQASKVADVVAEAVGNMIKKGDLNSALIFASDRHLYNSMKSLSGLEISETAHLFDVMLEDISPNGALVGFQKIHKELSKEVQCYIGPNGSRQTIRLDEINAQEQIRRRGDKQRLDHLLMVEAPFVLAGAIRDCNVPAAIMDNYEHVYRLGEKGGTPGLAAVNYWFYSSGRLNYLARSMNSSSLLSFANAHKLFSARGASAYLLESIRSLPGEDFNNLSSVLTEFATEELRGGDISNWIKTKLPKTLQDTALSILKDLKNPRFRDFVDVMAWRHPESEAILREALADSNFRRPTSDAFYEIVQKIFSPEMRPELVKLFSSLAKSWESTDGGIGPFLSVFAESNYLAQENPFQNWMRSIFEDRDFQKLWFKTSDKITQTPEFENALKFTAQFAKSPQFDGFLKFVIDIFRYSDQKGLHTDPLPDGYKKPTQPSYGRAPPLVPPSGSPPSFDYSACKSLRGSLWDRGGEVFYSALKCLGENRKENGLVKLAELLRQSGNLSEIADIFSRHYFNSSSAHDFLDDLQSLQRNGDLDAIMELLLKSGKVGPNIVPLVEKILADYLSQGSAKEASESLGTILKSKNFGDVLYTALDSWEKTDDKTFFRSNSSFTMPVPDGNELLKQAKQRVPKFDGNQAARALKTFINRDENYFYEQGAFEKASDATIQADIYRMFVLLLRSSREAKTGDIEEFVKALKEIFEWHRTGKVNLVEFVRWGTSSVKPVPYFVGEMDDPQVRFVSNFDQLDLLVINSNYSVAGWVPFFGVDHLGTYFQIQIAESNNLAETLESLRKKMVAVVNLGKPIIEREKYNHLLNNLENFTALTEANRLGHLVILQRLYRALYNATPPKDRDKQDPEKNHLSLMHQPTRWAMFSRMVAPLRHVDSQGQLDHFIGILGQLLKTLAPGDEFAVRAAIDNMVYRASGSASSLDHVLNMIFESSRDPELFDRVKDQFYHGTFALGRNLGKGRVLFEVLSEIKANLMGRMIDRYVQRLSKRDTDSDLKFISRWASLDTEQSRIMRAWTSEVSQLTPRGRTALAEVADPLLDIINSDEQTLLEFLDGLNVLLSHPDIKAKNMKLRLRRIFNEYKSVNTILPGILANPRDRQTLMDTTLQMARQKQLQDLTNAVVEIYNSGELMDLLTLINNYSVRK